MLAGLGRWGHNLKGQIDAYPAGVEAFEPLAKEES